MNSISFKKFDFVSILIVSILIIVGLVNIYSSTYFDNMSFFSFKNPFGKQLIFTLISLIIFFKTLSKLTTSFHETNNRFSFSKIS